MKNIFRFLLLGLFLFPIISNAKDYGNINGKGTLTVAGTTTLNSTATVSGNVGIGTTSTTLPLTVNGVMQGTVQDKGGQVFNVLAYGATGNGSTDDSSAVQSAINAAKTAGGILFFPQGQYLLNSPINLTNITSGLTIEGVGGEFDGASPSYGTQIIFNQTGIGFDMSGSNGMILKDFTVATGTNHPKCAFFMARNSLGSGAGMHRFYNIKTNYGSVFTVSEVYSYGSEENNYFGCEFVNNYSGGKVFYSTAYNNISTISSSFITIATGGQSNSVTMIYGGSFYNLGGSTSDIFYFDYAADFHIFGGFWSNATASSNGRAYIYVNTINAPSNNISIKGIRGEAGTYVATYGIYFSNDATSTPINWSFTDSSITANTQVLYASDNTTLYQLTYKGIQDNTGSGVSVKNLQYSDVDMESNSFVGRTSGALLYDSFKGNVALSFTLNGTSSGSTFYDYQSNKISATTFVGAVTGTASGNLTSSVSTLASLTSANGSTIPASDTLVGRATTDTLTNKRITLRKGSEASNATPSINSDSYNVWEETALAAAITTVSITGTPTEGQQLEVVITDNGTARALAWGSITATTVALPTTTVISTPIRVFLQYNGSTWYCVGVA